MTTFGDLAARGSLLLNDGYRTKVSELGRPGYPILRVAELGDGTITPSLGDHVREEYRGQIGAKISQSGDVLLTTKGTVGRRAIVPAGDTQFVYSPQLCFFRVLDQTIDNRWLYYWLGGAEFWAQALGVSQQTDMAPYVSLRDLRAIQVDLPPVAEQRAISATLGALDDKIESNRRAISVLQDLSTTFFSQWRQTRSTGFDTTFGAYADVYGGSTPRTTVPEYWDGHIPWATPTEVTRLESPYLLETSRMITDQGLASSTAVLHPPGTIFMTSRATIGAFAVNQVPAATNQGFIAVRPRRGSDRWFLFEEMRSRVPEFLDNSNGSTFQEISRGHFKELCLMIPANEEIEALDRQLAPLHDKAARLAGESQRLAHLRDALLPELLSGRITASAPVGTT